MKIIVCGAGQVGTSIAAYLSQEGNSVTVIDNNSELIAQMNDTMDVSGIIGHASHPDILAKAGAADAEMLIAATHADEVNMMSCQVAHSLFNVPVKVARLRDPSYMKPEWKNLFHRDHLPIDIIISPEVEVAKSIANRIKVPGAYNIIPLAEGMLKLVSVICKQSCPLLHTPLKHLTALFPDLSTVVLLIIRGDTQIIPSDNDQMLPGDEVYFVTSTEHLKRTMAAFGYEEPETRRVIIAGAGKIGSRLAQNIRNNMPDITVSLIERDPLRATAVSEEISGINIVSGSSLDRALLEEVGVDLTETLIAVMNSDESNVLAAMMAKQYGVERTIALVNNSSLTPLISALNIDAIVNPKEITVSTILQHIRRGRIKSAHSLRAGFAEVLEVEALDTSAIVNTPMKEIQRPKNMIFGLIVRSGKTIVPGPDTIIKPDDRVIILAAHDQVKKVEQMFAVRPEYF